MQVVSVKRRISLSDEIITDVKSGNLLKLTRSDEAAQDSDRVVDVVPRAVLVDGLTRPGFTFTNRKIDKFTFGRGMYDHLIEVEFSSKEIAAMVYWSSETGDFSTTPSMLTVGKVYELEIDVLRGAPRLEVQVQENVDWNGWSKDEKTDFILAKFQAMMGDLKLNEESAYQLATHRHYKGGLYRRMGEIRNADDGNSRTLYMHLYPHEVGLWHRDTEEFDAFLNTGERRFAPIEDSMPFILNDDGVSTQVTVALAPILETPKNGLLFTRKLAEETVEKLNRMANEGRAIGELGAPKKITADISDWNACCQFTNFGIAEVYTRQRKAVMAVVGRVQPFGPQAMSFLENMRVQGAGFAMRFFGDDVCEDGVSYLMPRSVITFDFVAPKK